jgi:cytochrome c-type biogenesis protein CcmH
MLNSKTTFFTLREAQHERIIRDASKRRFVGPELVEARTTWASIVWQFRASILVLLLFRVVAASEAPDLEEQTRTIASELRCVVCQNLSVADSPSEMAQQMRGIVREQLEAGKTPQEIKDYFVSKYGEWVLLAPTAKGFSLLLWVLPFVVLIGGIALALWVARRWAARKTQPQIETPTAAPAEKATLYSVQQQRLNPEGVTSASQLLEERGRFVSEINELEFDFQCGKLSEQDYTSLRKEIETKIASLARELASLPPQAAESPDKTEAPIPIPKKRAEGRNRLRRWQIVAGGTFLLLFGLTVGVLLTNSLRPRTSEQDSLTGDFLTGTTPATGDIASLLNQGKLAFANQDWPKAIEAFKQVLAADPNHPEAHSYMGFILIQAGHGDGALLAFEKALSAAPNLPMALWGKGLVLYREKQDYRGAREVLERLVKLLPAGDDRSEIEKVLAELSASDRQTTKPAKVAPPVAPQGQQISGTIRIEPKLKDQLDRQATLFIIARQAAGSGPPLAVQKIERPTFPLSYSLGAQNMMIQGGSFTGKMNISARLDKDGNPMTREAGNAFGEYKNNPVDAGSKNVDVVIDQVAR